MGRVIMSRLGTVLCIPGTHNTVPFTRRKVVSRVLKDSAEG